MIKKKHSLYIPFQTFWIEIILKLWTFLWNNSRLFEYIWYSDLLRVEIELRRTGFKISYYIKLEVPEPNILIISRTSKGTDPLLTL